LVPREEELVVIRTLHLEPLGPGLEPTNRAGREAERDKSQVLTLRSGRAEVA